MKTAKHNHPFFTFR